MNTLAIQRIAWKEFRQQRVFFVAMATITFLVSMLTLSVFRGVAGSEQWPMMITGIFAALFSAACGGTLYATEKEEGTFLNLQLMPLTSRSLMIGKVGTASAISFAFFAMCVLLVWIAGATSSASFLNTGDFGIAPGLFEFLAQFGLMVTEFFAWSLLFSLLLSRPLVASILGIVAASVVIQFVARFANDFLYEPFQLQTYMPTIVPRVVLVVLVLAVDAFVATRWLQVRKTERRSRKPLDANSETTTQPPLETSIGLAIASPRRLGMIGRFVWQALRTSWPYMLVYILLVPVAVIVGFITISAGLFCVVGAIVGSLAFTSDKTGNHAAFLANHGERPGAYWFGHSVCWFAWIVVVNLTCLACLLIWIAFNEGLTRQTAFLSEFIDLNGESDSEIVNILGVFGAFIFASIWWTGSALFGCAIGQWCSLLIDKRLLATLAAILVSVPAGIWLMLIFASDTPLWWTVLPMFVGLLFAGFLATKWWLGNRRSAWRISGLVLAGLVAGCFISSAVMWKRASDIPVGDFDFSVARPNASDVDAAIVNKIRVRLANAFESYPGTDQPLFSFIDHLMSKMLDARHLGQGSIDFKKLCEQNDSLDSSWKAFVESNPGATIENQIALVQNHVAESQPHLDRLHEALLFAIDNISHVQNLPPWQPLDEVNSAIITPPIPYKQGANYELLRVSFFQAALDGNSHETWLALKRLLWMNTLHSQTWGYKNSTDHFVMMFNTWLSVGVPNEADLRDALSITQQEWFLLTDPLRVGEAEYLSAKSRAVQNLDLMKSHQNTLRQFVYDWIPSERIRTNKLIDLLYAYRGSRLTMQQPVTRDQLETWNREWDELLGENRDDVLQQWVDTTILPHEVFSDSDFSASAYSKYDSRHDYHFLRHYWDEKSRQQLEILVLKLGAMVWQLDHGAMPTTPAELTSLIGTQRPVAVRYPWLPDDKWYNEYFFASVDGLDGIEINLVDEQKQANIAGMKTELARVPRIINPDNN